MAALPEGLMVLVFSRSIRMASLAATEVKVYWYVERPQRMSWLDQSSHQRAVMVRQSCLLEMPGDLVVVPVECKNGELALPYSEYVKSI